MDKIKLVPKKWRPIYMNKLGIPFTKGYKREFDLGYETKSKEWLAANPFIEMSTRLRPTLSGNRDWPFGRGRESRRSAKHFLRRNTRLKSQASCWILMG